MFDWLEPGYVGEGGGEPSLVAAENKHKSSSTIYFPSYLFTGDISKWSLPFLSMAALIHQFHRELYPGSMQFTAAEHLSRGRQRGRRRGPGMGVLVFSELTATSCWPAHAWTILTMPDNKSSLFPHWWSLFLSVQTNNCVWISKHQQYFVTVKVKARNYV